MQVDCCEYRDGGQFIGNHYGAGSGPIWLNNVQCSGSETNITECQRSDWGRHNCTHDNDVSVSCIAGIITNRLQFTPLGQIYAFKWIVAAVVILYRFRNDKRL